MPDEKDEKHTQKSNLDRPQEEFIGDEAEPSVTEKELRERKEKSE